MYKIILCVALCALNIYGMKQKQLIEKVIKHKRGLFCLDKILDYIGDNESNERGPLETKEQLLYFLNHSINTKHHWFYDKLAHNPANRINIYDPSVMHECGGTTGADLAYPFPEILIETAKPWLNRDETYVEPKLLKKSEKLQQEKDQNDYYRIHAECEELINKIGKRKEDEQKSRRANYPFDRARVFPPLELSSYEKQALYRYDFDSTEHLYWRNNDLFHTLFTFHGPIRHLETKAIEVPRITRQKKILNNLLAHQRGLIIFNYLKSKNIRSDHFRYNIDLDQSIIYECGGNNITSILLPDPSLFTACITSEAFKELNTMKRRIESIHAQQEKDYEVYHRLAKENPLVFAETNSMSFEDATALEAYGFYGKIALFKRNSSLYESIENRLDCTIH